MKKKITTLLVVLLSLAMAIAFVGCKKDKPTPKTPKVEPSARTQTDTRTNAYTAFKKDGTEIGKYKTIAEAINNAVASDSFGSNHEVTEYGSYVKNGDVVVFKNRNGYAPASDDQFWFYTNGTQLEAYDCWDNTLHSDFLKNSKVITHQVGSRGSVAKQYHSGYGLYNPSGEVETEKSAQSWELSSTMDAAALYFPARLKGVTGLDYELDLSSVQIKPNYEGSNDTYAYIGFYSWQDYYVIAHGIACDVRTGAWYPFEGTSRDDSFHDVKYKLGDAPLMVSNWVEDGGYWAPEYPTVKMSIRTTKYTDDIGDYYANKLNVDFLKADGTKDGSYEYVIDDSVVQRLFSAAAYGTENSFIFIAGLDVKTPVDEGGRTPNTDYTNGAEFKNLKVVKATAHVPAESEISVVDYGYDIEESWRGKDHNILMASGDHTAGVFDYTVLNVFACASYEKSNGADVFSFSYAGSNVAESALGGKLAEYQAQIDELKAATSENVLEMGDKIDAIALMYADGNVANSNVAQKYYTVLDFAPYLAAQQLFNENSPLSEKGQEYANKFNELPSLESYAYVGYASEEENAEGYIKNDVLAFKALYDEYNSQLTEDDKKLWKYNVIASDYNAYVDLMEKIAAYAASTETIASKTEGNGSTMVEYKVEEAVAEIMLWSNRIANGTSWADYPGSADDTTVDRSRKFNSDHNWLASYHVLFLKARLAELGFELPTYIENVISLETGFDEDFAYLDAVLTIAKGIEDGTYLYVTEEVAEIVNATMVGKVGFVEGGLNWNFTNSNPGNSDFAYRDKSYKLYYGLNKGTLLNVYIEKVQALLVRAGAVVDGIGITSAVEAQNVVLTEAATPVVELFKSQSDYRQVATDFTKYDEAVAAYNALSDEDKLVVQVLSDYSKIVEAMEAAKTQLAAVNLEDVAGITLPKQMYYDATTERAEITAADALAQLNTIICKIKAGDSWVAEVDSDYGNASTKMDGDNTWYQSIRVVLLMKHFEENNVELPEFFTPILDAIGYNAFLEAYNSIYQTIKLSETYVNAGKTVADMTDEDKAALDKYWAKDYAISSVLNWNWNTGHKFEDYFSARVRAIAVQYAYENSYTFGDDVTAKKVRWIYGDAVAEYSYKDETYIAFVYEDECPTDMLFGALMKGFWERAAIYVDAEGNICAADAEGATRLMTTTEGVTKTDKAEWGENCVGVDTAIYVTADEKEVYKPYKDGAIDYNADGFVDKYNRPVELTEEQLAQVKFSSDGVVKVFAFYDKLGAWLKAQGYTLNANGWGAEAPATAEA